MAGARQIRMGQWRMQWKMTLVLIAAGGAIVGTAHQDTGSIGPRPSGEEYLWTFAGAARGTDMVVDDNGYAYVTGETTAADFPTTEGAYDRTCGTDGRCDATGGKGSNAWKD